jgi:adenine-specific DNA-methyltransferase
MRTIIESESLRLSEQTRLDKLKTAAERNRWGQFATPPMLALDIARFVWNKLKHRGGHFSFLDPAIGTGSFFSALRQAFPKQRIKQATGIELDPLFADAAKAIWTKDGLEVIQGDFARQEAKQPCDILLTNPPYVRHHHLDRESKRHLGQLAFEATGLRLSGLSGLYCYFLFIAHSWMADQGIAAWLIPSEFMDVNYGDEVKQFLTEQVSLLHIHRFCPSDVQFDDALVSSAVVVFEKSKPATSHKVTISFGGTLNNPANSQRIGLDDLRGSRKWTALARPAGKQRASNGGVLLGDLFTVKRGIATGSNSFFIVPTTKLHQLGIPLEWVRPILPSPRFLKQQIIEGDENGWPIIDPQLALIDCPLPEDGLRDKWPGFWSYLESGMERGIPAGFLASRRSPWYSQEKRPVPSFLCTYMGRSVERPFRFIWNKSTAIAANVYLLMYPREHVARAILNSGEAVFDELKRIRPDQFLSEGRVYGGGLHKVEPAELMRVAADELGELLGFRRARQGALF